MPRLKQEEAMPMESQQLLLASLCLLGVLGEYPSWGICPGTWAWRARGEMPVLPMV